METIKKIKNKIFWKQKFLNQIGKDCLKIKESNQKIESQNNSIYEEIKLLEDRLKMLEEKCQTMNAETQNKLFFSLDQLQQKIEYMSNDNLETACFSLRENKKKLLIAGFYGAPNMGDEYMLETLLDYLKNQKEWNITILLANNPDYKIQNYPNVSFVHYPKNNIDCNRMAQYYDHLIWGGGAIIDDENFENKNAYKYYLGNLIIELSNWFYAFEKKVSFIAVSSNKTIPNSEYMSALEKVVEQSNYFSIRDKYFLEYLKKTVKSVEKLKLCNDIVLANQKLLIPRTLPTREKIKNIGIIWISTLNDTEKLEMVIETLNNKYSDENIKIHLIPFYHYLESDSTYYKKIINTNQYKNIELTEIPFRIADAIKILDTMDLVISLRYHGVLLCHARGIKCLPICLDQHKHYPNKIKYINELFRVNVCLNYSDLDQNGLMQNLETLEKGAIWFDYDLLKTAQKELEETVSKIILDN